jgi:GT2 family glycosyltransferase
MIDVSIVIVSWNTREITRDCLRSIYAAGEKVGFEVILIDNHSGDGSAEMVAENFPDVILLRNEENRGFAAANNQGIALARGRYVLLLNSDTVVVDGAIAKAVAFADAHPKAGMIGCQTRCSNGNLQYNCYLFPSLLNLALSLTKLQVLFWYKPFFGRYRLGWWDYGSVREVDGIAGCFMLARKAAIDQVGPMAEEYFMYSEDTDWCWRFHRAGWKVLYTPEPVIIHLGGCSSSQAATDMHLMERRSLLMFLEKKSGKLARWVANVMFCTATLCRVVLLSLQRIAGGQVRESARQKWGMAMAALRFHVPGLFLKRPEAQPR